MTLLGLWLLAALPSAGPSALSQLAGSVSEEILRLSKGRPVQVELPTDRTGRTTSRPSDLRSLILTRLEGRLVLKEAGPRLRIESVLWEAPGKIGLSARIVDEPGGRLVDLLTASADADPAVLALSPPSASFRTSLEVTTLTRTPPLSRRILDLAFIGDDLLAVLSEQDVSLYACHADSLRLKSKWPLGAIRKVRAPAGMIVASESEAALWVLTNELNRATLLGVDGGALQRRVEADALPWPGCRTGLRYRPGTNLLEGDLPGFGEGPFLSLGAGLALSPEGELLPATGDTLRLGPPLVPLWKDLIAASSASPPGESDWVQIVSGERHLLDSLPVEGTIRALASRPGEDGARLVVGVEEAQGSHLLVLGLRRRP